MDNKGRNVEYLNQKLSHAHAIDTFREFCDNKAPFQRTMR